MRPRKCEPRRPLFPARDADQDFLRHMLDHHETVVVLVHTLMMSPAGHAAHGTKVDPSGWDMTLDIEKREMLAMLKKSYSEEYSPRAQPVASGAMPAALSGMEGVPIAGGAPGEKAEAEHTAGRARLAVQRREGTTLTGRFMPKLRRPAVRELARRLRASQLALAGALDTGVPKQ